MSRRKQSNPKSIKVSTDSSDAEGTEKDADAKEMLDPGEGTESWEGKKEARTSRQGSPDLSADSPDHIDVVGTCHSPPQLAPPSVVYPAVTKLLPQEDSSSAHKTVIKMEQEESEKGPPQNDAVDSHQNNGHGNAGNSPAGDSATQRLIRHLQLPNDVLYLKTTYYPLTAPVEEEWMFCVSFIMKELEVTVHGSPTASWMVCSAIPLPKGSSLGPFAGDMVSSDNIRVGDLIVEFHSKTGHIALVNVAGHSGAWLALLRPAVNGVTRNTLVYLEGGRIWCEIVSDVEIGMELRATFVFDFEDLSVADRELSTAPLSSGPATPDQPSASISPPLQQTSVSALQQPSPPGHAALIYGCPFCGVRFSSPRTLQGHLSYYCSKKRSEHIVSPRPRSRRSSDSQGGLSMPTDTIQLKKERDLDIPHNANGHMSQLAAKRVSCNKRPPTSSESSSSDHSSPPPAKIPCLDNQTFQCSLCSYRADKAASLNRHMRIHNRQPGLGGKTSPLQTHPGSTPAAGSIPSSATFCKECNIQFSSLSTYRCHKEHYCSQRQAGHLTEVKEEGSQYGMVSQNSVGMPNDLPVSSLQLTSLGQSGLLFPPGQGLTCESSSLTPGSAVMTSGQGAVILTAPIMTPSGLTSMAIPLPTMLVQSIHNAAAAAAAHATAICAPISPRAATSPRKSASPKRSESLSTSLPEEAHKSKSPKRSRISESENTRELPLDLSTKKSDCEDSSAAGVCGVEKERDEERSPEASGTLRRSPVTARHSSTDSPDNQHGSSSPSVNSAIPPSMAGIPPPLLNASLLHGFLPMSTLTATGMAGLAMTPQSQAFGAVTAGVSKCTDCNIIFYKHENFLVHKQLYCSGKKLRSTIAVPAPSPRPAESEVLKPEPAATVTSAAEPRTSPSPQSCSSLKKDQSSGSSSLPSQTSPGASIKLPVRSSLVTTSGLEDVYYKFFCIPCKIKFSSASNLKAHKEYYCPHGKNSEHTIIAQTQNGDIVSAGSCEQPSPNSSGSSPSPGQYCCSQCRATFTSSRLLKLHLCSADVAQSSLLRCSHCDYITHTDKRLAEHMKVHNPTSAYRCTLCGYRGNTVRGMRMHGKSHTDNGEDFTDSHMIEFQEPPLVPIQTNSEHKASQGPVDMEAELLRLKNEPYKRRRSRKAYEKVDILVPINDSHSCQLCGECFGDSRSLTMHLRIHEIASQYVQEFLHCNHCDFVSKSVHELRAHLEISHAANPREEKENHPESRSPDKTPISDRRNFERAVPVEKRSPIYIKEEPIDRDYEHNGSAASGPVTDEHKKNASATEDSFLESPDEKISKEHCNQETSMDNLPKAESSEDTSAEKCSESTDDKVCIKIEPGLDRDEDSCNDPPLPITFAISVSASQPSQVNTVPSLMQSTSIDSQTGQANTSLSASPPRSRSSPVRFKQLLPSFSPKFLPMSTSSLFPKFLVAPSSSPCPLAVEAAGSSTSHEINGIEEQTEDKPVTPYCENCDISFNYHSTFVAHKKYYCTKNSGLTPSATA